MLETNQRLRVASLQYFIRPVQKLDDFKAQVAGLVETAADYGCKLIVFPEYFTLQLLTLGNVRSHIKEQILQLTQYQNFYLELMTDLAVQNKIYIVGGSIAVKDENGKVYNNSYLFSPNGNHGVQGKIHMTRFEAEEWEVSPKDTLKIFETDFGKMAITICYDVEFPELARSAARQGANLLIVPSCTDDRQGFLRVRYCAQARAIENQMYVIHSSTVGSLPMVPAVALNYGQASILTPSDFPFARDGILAEGLPNQESIVIGELNLNTIQDSRSNGTVLPLKDSNRTLESLSAVKLEIL